jgi:SAM-dependent methyltransferase
MSENGSALNDDMRNRMRTAYDAMAEARDRKEFPDWKRDVRESFLGVLHREGRTRLLEIGAGTGRDSAFFAEHGLDVVCADLSPEMVRLCREKGLDAQAMDVVDLRFPDGAFDAVYSLNSFLHLPESEFLRALREVRRVLQPGGIFFLGVYGGIDREGVWEEDAYEPKRFFSFRTDERLLEAVGGVFDVVSFDRVAVEAADPRFHFQSLILRKRGRSG